MSEEIDFDAPNPDKPVKPTINIKRNIVYAGIFTTLMIMAFIYTMAGLINENAQCVDNPFVYGASRIESSQGDPKVMCSCEMINNGAFWFDDEEVYMENPHSQTLDNINFTISSP